MNKYTYWDLGVDVIGTVSTLPSPIDSSWTPWTPGGLHLFYISPHGVQVESRWNSTNIAYSGFMQWTPPGLHGLHLDSYGLQVESRWNPTEICKSGPYILITIIYY